MKKLVLAIMAIVLFVSNTNAQEKLSAEDQASLQEIVKKVTSVAEEKARVVTFELNYKESFELANFVVDEESELAKKLSSSLDEAKFNALKGNVKLTYANGDFEVFATDDMNNIGNAILAHAKERLVKGLYVPRSLEGGLSYGQEKNLKEILIAKKCSINLRNVENNDDIQISFKNDLKEFCEFNLNERYEITFTDNNYTVYSYRQMAYNLKNNFNYSIFFILDDKNNLIDTTIQKDSNLDDVNKSIEYYNLDGTLTDSFIYNIKDKSITAQLIKTDSISEARMSVSACTRRCVVAIYEESDYGLACSVISAFLPETFLAVVVGCRIGCR